MTELTPNVKVIEAATGRLYVNVTNQQILSSEDFSPEELLVIAEDMRKQKAQ